jgi:ubiquinone biosynthesis protein Coq4
MNLSKLWIAFRAYLGGEPLGDVAVLKLDALRAAPAGVDEKLRGVDVYAPPPSLATLRALPEGTLGREYARFLDANGIVPLAISFPLRQRFSAAPYALRYTTTHDLHHVLTGFDAGLAGEAGVVAFNVGQGAAPVSRAMLSFVRFFYSVLSPTQATAIANDVRVGLAMGERAKLVMAEPIETWMAEPLASVRERLRIPDPGEAGVMKSGASVVARAFMRPPRAPALGQ